MSAVQKIGRRGFLKAGVAATGGLLVGFYLPGRDELAAAQGPFGAAPAALYPNAFVHINADETITLIVHKPENGQGTETSIAMLLAEELECDWKKVKTEFAPINAQCYGGAMQGTFGSQAVRTVDADPPHRRGHARHARSGCGHPMGYR